MVEGLFFSSTGCPYCMEAKKGILQFNIFKADITDHITEIDIAFPDSRKTMLKAMSEKLFKDGAHLPTLIVKRKDGSGIGFISSVEKFHFKSLLSSLKKRMF